MAKIIGKAELIDKIAKEANVSKETAKKTFDATFGAIKASLVKGDKVRVYDFGTFQAVKRKARNGFNPATGTKVKYPATKRTVFKPGKSLKEAVAKKK